MKIFKIFFVGRVFLLLAFAALCSSCAILHHVQVGSVQSPPNEVAIPFEILMSEMGVSTEEIGKIANSMNKSGNSDVGNAAAIVSLFQIGPKTGLQVYNERYAEKLVYEIHQKCPSGRVTGLMSIREMRKYPVISGEIVKVTGYCLKARKTSENTNLKNNKDET